MTATGATGGSAPIWTDLRPLYGDDAPMQSTFTVRWPDWQGGSFTPEEWTYVLLTIAVLGDLEHVRQQLAWEGLPVPLDVLEKWRDLPQYREVSARYSERIKLLRGPGAGDWIPPGRKSWPPPNPRWIGAG
jgi:hypothetical protein